MSERAPHLELHLRHRVGTIDLAIDLQLTQPWTILFGASGSGKTTILRSVAGLIRPAEARVVFRRSGGAETQVAFDTSANIFVAPHRRWTRWSAQTPALFPNQTVRQNLECAVERLHDAPRASRSPSIDEALEHFRLDGMASKYPHALSGGERQRVSVARAAIAANGRLLMLDEPFTGLDARLRDTLLADLRGFLSRTRTPVLSVTHDLGEAFLVADEVVKIAAGLVEARGPAADVLAGERGRLLKALHAEPFSADGRATHQSQIRYTASRRQLASD